MKIFNRRSVHSKDCVCAKCIIDKDKEKNDITTNAKIVIEKQISESEIIVEHKTGKNLCKICGKKTMIRKSISGPNAGKRFRLCVDYRDDDEEKRKHKMMIKERKKKT